MENNLFTNRLQKLLKYYDLSASNFATKIGVQRSSISHVLSGRNKPSLDFVMKVLHTFEEVSIEWLVDGIGSFPKSNITSTPIQKIEDKSIVKKDTHFQTQTPIISKPSNLSNSNKSIDKIIILYTDGSFESFKN